MRATAVLALVTAAATGAGCQGREAPAPAAPVDAAEPLDLIHPPYPERDGPDDPLALRVCAALHGLPAARRRACCPATATAPADADRSAECAHRLSAAVRRGALRIEGPLVDGCTAAMQALHEGCGWVGLEPLLAPAACRRLVLGLTPARTGCRSSLECQGDLHCEGLAGPPAPAPGVCRPARHHGAACAPAADPLADLLLADQVEADHPGCTGHCERGRCVTPITIDGPCVDSRHCGPGLHCAHKRCASGPWPLLAEECTTRCEGLARCQGGLCVGPPAQRPCAR